MQHSTRFRFLPVAALVFAAFLCVTAASVGQGAETAAGERFARDTRVMLFWPGVGQWTLVTFSQTRAGCEFLFNNRLYRVVDADTARMHMTVSAGSLFEADRPADRTGRRPGAGDLVQLLDSSSRPTGHDVLSAVQPGSTIRFQGKGYAIAADRSLSSTGTVYAPTASSLQHIEITASGFQHVTDRHTVGGSTTSGKSVFYPNEDIRALIKNAELVVPVVEANGYYKRLFDAGRAIGYYPDSGKRVSSYRVITTREGKLVTSYPSTN